MWGQNTAAIALLHMPKAINALSAVETRLLCRIVRDINLFLTWSDLPRLYQLLRALTTLNGATFKLTQFFQIFRSPSLADFKRLASSHSSKSGAT